MRLGIRGLLATALFALLAAAGGVAAALTGHFLAEEAAQQVRRQQQLRAGELAERLVERCAAGIEACTAAPPGLAAASGDDLEEVEVLLADLTGGIGPVSECARRDPLVLTAAQTRTLQADVEERGPCERGVRFVVAVPTRLPDGRRVVARLAFDPGPVEAGVAARRNLVLWSLLADFGAVLVFGIYVVGRWVVRPLQALTRETERLSVEGLAPGQAPAQPQGAGPAEVVRLQAAYAAMLTRLAAQQADLAEKLRELEAARDDLVRAEKLALVGRLAAGIAHEVGNPLAAVLGFLEYLRDERGAPPDLQRELLARMDRELNRIRDTIRQLLDFSRPSPSEPRPTDPNEVVQAALDLLRYHPKLKALRLDTRLAATRWAHLDPERLRQVLVNLLLNAADALAGTGTIVVETADAEDALLIAVTDDGPGFAPGMAERAFDPFVTTKPAGEGTGLGLAICQRLVEEVGGRITARDNPGGRGARFEVRVPAHAAPLRHNTEA